MLERIGCLALLALTTCAPTTPPARVAAPPAASRPATRAAGEAAPAVRAAEEAPRRGLPSALARHLMPAEIEQAWSALPSSANGCAGEFDYFPKGGMRIFYCHVKGQLSYAALQRLAGVPAFVEGPHSRDALDLKSTDSFGRYNPVFVRWLADHLIPGPRLQERTQPIYDRLVRPLARIFHATYRKLHGSRYLREEKARYLALVKARSVPPGHYEKYFFVMNPRYFDNPDGGFEHFHRRGFDGGVNGNVVKTCVAFWIRRSIDGTAADFAAGLERLLAAYDPDFLAAARRAGPRADWGRLVSAGAR